MMIPLLLVITTLQDDEAAKASTKQEPEFTPSRELVYKRIGDVELRLHVFEPNDHSAEDQRSAIVFFFGGGWVGGSPKQFYPHCRHLADQGMVAMAAEYRVRNQHQSTPFDCVADGKSALRYVRAHADQMGIHPDRIAAGGGSAGGHVAAAVATVSGLNEEGEDTTVSCLPQALVLFNPVYDNGPDGYGHERVGDRYREISPLHNISSTMPPAIVFLGTNDKLIPVATAESFRDRMKDAGVRSELHLYEDQAHGFFNHGRSDNIYFKKTVAEMDRFLKSLGLLGDQPVNGS